ncbi:hypothetical protein CDD81_1534 [Ophiocordyceps australis]|uniref:T-complex protein 11-like protein 1 n=1 Tax=Ophiocordyceps australis TaxID=1399860 RepID=A0A2C5YAT3_9HYPO|nr:hypothetical protein CDD81_1534 [Ophiocordyceps australis]
MHLPSPGPDAKMQQGSCSASDEAMDLDLDLAMPPADDDALEQNDRIYTPPPRIAARFYRPSQTRRRGSAASSRRNSMSSAHSRCSSLQHSASGEGEQSKYVAQHLRRASFLEDRRARLADRAAHAEKVRLRAAMAKAAPRGQSASEERALAAQQARQRNLAEIVASCAEEVRKAKQVAEVTKEKREQEIAKMKAKMEDRMAEAERRREELRNKTGSMRCRGHSIAARKAREASPRAKDDEAPKISRHVAAARIQDWWRGCRRKGLIDDFNALGLSVDGIRETSFDTVVELLGQEKVLVTTGGLLRICGLHEGEAGSVGDMAAVRTVLSAFLILGHPNQVLSNKNEGDEDDVAERSGVAAHVLPSADLENPQLQDLVGKAKDLLIVFEKILARLTWWNRYTMPPALKKTLPETYAVFYNAFIAWKSRDCNALVDVMVMQFVELDAIFQTVKDSSDDGAAALYRQSIEDSQLMLIVRIKKLAGQEKGRRLIFKAVSEARRGRNAKKRTDDTKPRVADNETGDGSAEMQTPTPPSTPMGTQEAKGVGIKSGLNGLLPDNRIVVHELAINKEYQIPWEEYVEQQAALSQPLYGQIRRAVGEQDGEACFGFFMLMAGKIRDKLQRLLKPGNSMYKLIGEMLDAELAQRQFALGNFSYQRFFGAMGSLLPKLCAPFRDEQVKELVQRGLADGDVIERVEALNGFIDVMVCDYINYLLRMAAPQLIESSAQYEAKRFEADMGGSRLEAAEAAWRSAASKVVGEVQPTASRIYAQMLVDVFTQLGPIEAEAVPEMLRLDVARMNAVSTTMRRIVMAGAVLVQCKNLLKRDVRSPWKTEAARVMAVLEAKSAAPHGSLDGVMAALEAGRSMPAVTRSHLRALVAKVLAAGRDMAEPPREPVLRLLLTRLRGNLLARLTPTCASDRVRATTLAGEKLAALGLSEFAETVRHLADLLDKVGAVDRAAHGPWWDAVAARVELQTDAQSALK